MSPLPCVWQPISSSASLRTDWRPNRSRKDAVRAWTRLGGIRFQVMQTPSLLTES